MLKARIHFRGGQGVVAGPTVQFGKTSLALASALTPRGAGRATLSRQAVEPIGAFVNLRIEARSEAPLEGRRMGGIAVNRVWQRGRQQRPLGRIEVARALMEVAARRSLDSVEPVAPFGDVEINLERARF
jgi:hypothetical protein